MEKVKEQDEFQQFLLGLSIEKILLQKLSADIKPTFSLPATISNSFEHEYKKQIKKRDTSNKDSESEFSVISTYCVTALQEGKKDLGLKIAISYLAHFKSCIQINDEIFNKFKESYLLLTIYPYCRYMIQDITVKMGLPPLLLNLMQLSLDEKEPKKG